MCMSGAGGSVQREKLRSRLLSSFKAKCFNFPHLWSSPQNLRVLGAPVWKKILVINNKNEEESVERRIVWGGWVTESISDRRS